MSLAEDVETLHGFAKLDADAVVFAPFVVSDLLHRLCPEELPLIRSRFYRTRIRRSLLHFVRYKQHKVVQPLPRSILSW